MIYSLKGNITEKLFRSVIIDVNGVGYEVQVGTKDLNNIILDSNITLYTQLVIGESEHVLYGFVNKNSIALFKLLNSVSGVGPRTAFNILDASDISDLISAISNADKSFFKIVKGVGPKSALKIIVELQDKVGKLKELDLSPVSKQDEEIIEALKSMGYDRDNIVEVLKDLDDSLNEQLKLKTALKLLSK